MSSLVAIREALRKARDEEDMTLDALAGISGVDRAVIHRIENTVKYPNYEPGIDTVRRLIEGMGRTLTDFFGDAERLPALFNQQGKKDLPRSAVKDDTAGSPPKDPNGDQVPQTADRLSDAIELLGDEIINALNRINTTFGGVERRLESIDGKFDALRGGRAPDHEQAASRSAQASRQRPRSSPRTRKTG